MDERNHGELEELSLSKSADNDHTGCSCLIPTNLPAWLSTQVSLVLFLTDKFPYRGTRFKESTLSIKYLYTNYRTSVLTLKLLNFRSKTRRCCAFLYMWSTLSVNVRFSPTTVPRYLKVDTVFTVCPLIISS